MSIFSKVAMPRPPSNTFDLSHDRKFSGRIGELMPISVMECVPGDKFNIKATNLTRFAPLITPIMHKASVYCHFFFVPNRILWDKWETFISGSVDGQYPNTDPSNPAYSSPTFPKVSLTTADGYAVSSLADYLGLPTGQNLTNVSALPFAAYQKIYNDYYRDENLIAPDEVTLLEGGQTLPDTLKLQKLQKRAWQHDYYTSALPWTQKGPEATLPLGTTAPVNYVNGGKNFLKDNTGSTIGNYDSSGVPLKSDGGASSGEIYLSNPGTQYVNWDNSDSLSVNLSGATAASINELRRAFRLQEWLERNARGGTRYIEIIMAHFGVMSSDARLQRPEFLGGPSTPVTISEVLQTSDNSGGADGGPQGNMAGHGVSVGSSDYVTYKCEEHGYIMGIMSVMPMTAYQQGIPKHFSKFDKFDYYWPSFANIGEQAIEQKELYYENDVAKDTATFGYTPRYAEYKYLPSTVHGTFRTSLNFWHMGRIFSTAPALNQDFIECDYEEVDRVFADQTPGAEHLYVYLHNEVKCNRLMPYFGTPTI
jgi:hypothetical protein